MSILFKINTDQSNNHKLNVDNLGNAKLSAIEYQSGLSGTRYVGYHGDDPAWFETATPHGDTNTLTSIDNFSSSPNFSSEDYYSWQWLGYFKPSTSEVYTFYTSSDDGSYLWVGEDANNPTTGNALVNNGGGHPSQEISGTISLTANTYYPIRIQFGEMGGGDIMTVSFSSNTISKTTNGSGYYFHQLV